MTISLGFADLECSEFMNRFSPYSSVVLNEKKTEENFKKWILAVVVALVTLCATSAVVLAMIVSSDKHTSNPITMDARFSSGRNETTAVPLILDMHGAGGTPEFQFVYSQMITCANRNNWHIHYPSGYQNTWNAGPGTYEPAASHSDHVREIETIVVDLKRRINVSLVFVTGLSNGCAMALRLGMESDFVDAVACTSHAMHQSIAPRNDSRMPLMLLTADDDYIFASEESVAQTLETYALTNGCESGKYELVSTGETDITWKRAQNCSAPVEHLSYASGGHMTTAPTRSSEKMCGFFERVTRREGRREFTPSSYFHAK